MRRQLAPHQIQCLNAIGAFINHRNARIADILAHAPFFDIAVPTKDLLHIGADFIALIGAIAFDNWREQREQIIRQLPIFWCCRFMCKVRLNAAP